MREIREESGISVLTFIKELGTYQRYKIGATGQDDTNELKTITMFMFRTSQIDLSPNDAANPEARWVEPEQVVDLLTHTKDREFFRAYVLGNEGRKRSK